jgi:hypothetical protein
MSNWVEHIVEEHKEFESPLSFWRWAAIAAISAVVKDSVWINRGTMYDLYPNIYVMFHAESGLKKGPPVALAKKLVKEVNNTRIISGRSSIQGILKEMGTASSAPGGKVVKGSVAFICSSELSSSIVEDKVATTILTDLYDRQYNVGEWRSLLKMESFDLQSPCVTMLTATNEAHSDSFFVRRDIKGGYFARTFIIYESEANRINSLLVPPEVHLDYKQDALYLKELSKLRGAFMPLGSREQSDAHPLEYRDTAGQLGYYTPAGLIYQRWYDEFTIAARQARDPTGTLNRFGDSVLKVAMLLSLAHSPCLEISEAAMTEAIETCEKLIGNVRKATMGKTEEEGTNAVRKTLLLTELMARDNHAISFAQINKKYWIQGTVVEWQECITSFIEAGIVRLNTIGNQQVIEMTPEAIRDYSEYFKGRVK